MQFRCGSLMLCFLVSVAASAPVGPPIEDADWLERSRRILDQSAAAPAPDWLKREPSASALEAANEVASRASGAPAPAVANSACGRILIFASFSIPRPALKALLAQATDPNVTLVLRGVPRGATVPEAVRRLKQLVSEDGSVPNVLLDPTLFRRHQVQRVPTFVLERGAGEQPVVAVGAVNVGWLRRMASMAQHGTSDLGKRAEDYEIAEVDFIQEMQQRLARIDWAARREAAIEGFWLKHEAQFVSLPEARERRERRVNPSVRVTEDLLDAEGRLLVAAGHTINPLNWAPLSKTIIVFRGTDPRHVATATHLARAAQANGRGVILLTTSIDPEQGWQHLSQLERTLAGSVYVLPKALVDRFEISHIPATVASRGHELVVTEVPPESVR